MVCRQDMTWRQIHRPTNVSQMLDGLVSASKPKFQYLHRSSFWVFHVLCLSGAGWSRLPWVCYQLCLMWPSQIALHQQAYYPQVALELKCWCFQLLPWVHPSHPALCWNWWAVNSSYVGSSCALPHPCHVPHKLVHWDRATFPLHIPYFPICPVFCDGPWSEGSYTDQNHVSKLQGCCLASLVLVSFMAFWLLSLEVFSHFSKPILCVSSSLAQI